MFCIVPLLTVLGLKKMAITAALVKELRERTGAGMMDCKKALVDSNGDIEAAIDAMRKSGAAKAAKKSGRTAAEGVIVIELSDDRKHAVMVEVNCETDFVAKDSNFLHFAHAVGKTALAVNINDVAGLHDAVMAGSDATVEAQRAELVTKVGENVQVRRLVRKDSQEGHFSEYLHGARIGVLVELLGGDDEVGHDVAMHIAANKPQCVDADQVDPAIVNHEREIFLAQAETTDKPAAIIEKMVAGRVNKFLKEITLTGQPFLKDADQTVGQFLKSKGASVKEFVRLEVGEGIEKKVENFAEEVMAQVNAN